MTTAQVVQNERTAVAQKVNTLPDGPGLRIGKRSVLVGIIPLVPGGGSKFRERLPQFQAEAAYWEERVGTVHDFNMILFDNDTKMYFTVVYDGDFKPYLEDLKKAAPWFDNLMVGVGDGWKGMNDPGFVKYLSKTLITPEFFYANYPEATCRDVKKALRVQGAFEHLLDEAQS